MINEECRAQKQKEQRIVDLLTDDLNNPATRIGRALGALEMAVKSLKYTDYQLWQYPQEKRLNASQPYGWIDESRSKLAKIKRGIELEINNLSARLDAVLAEGRNELKEMMA